MANTFDPNEQTVAEVVEYLAQADDSETERILEAEEDGQARIGILNSAEAQAYTAKLVEVVQEAKRLAAEAEDKAVAVEDDGTVPADPAKGIETKGLDFQEAAKVATPDAKGYLGHSPERERTGRADKGLSQQNPAVMRGGAVPDSRRGVDDSDALEA